MLRGGIPRKRETKKSISQMGDWDEGYKSKGRVEERAEKKKGDQETHGAEAMLVARFPHLHFQSL